MTITHLNYDAIDDREMIQQRSWLPNTTLLVLDELHKMPDWKNYLKGVYDTKPEQLKILVTGSARLALFQQVGDSLAGRFFMHHLYPLSLAELAKLEQPLDLERLLVRGGFPEPYLAELDVDAERWRLQYTQSLLSVDVLDFAQIQNLRALQTVFVLLRHRVGSSISYSSIARDVNVSPATVKQYIQVLEALYIVFRITPFSKNIARSLLKEPKIYFFDNGLVQGDEGAKFENMVANALWQHCAEQQDTQARIIQLHYLRTKDQREVDFALVEQGAIVQAIEAKVGDKQPNADLKYFTKKYDFPGIQVVKYLVNEHQVGKIAIRQGMAFLKNL